MPRNRNDSLTAKQLNFLLRGVKPAPITLRNWREDNADFKELEALIQVAKARTGEDMVVTARTIVQQALNGELGVEEQMRLDTALKVLQRYPAPLSHVVHYKKWQPMNMQTIPEKKRRRILEELETDRVLKEETLPVDHVGHTAMGRVIGRPNPTDADMWLQELGRGSTTPLVGEGDE